MFLNFLLFVHHNYSFKKISKKRSKKLIDDLVPSKNSSQILQNLEFAVQNGYYDNYMKYQPQHRVMHVALN